MADHGGKRTQAGRKPGSPNKATAAIRSLAGEHAETAIDMLVELMEDGGTPAAARISAAKELLERGYGKSGSYAALELDIPLSELQPKEAIAAITDAVTAGAISVEEGQRLVAMIEARIKAVELAEVEDRLSALEGNKAGRITQ
ncbi:MAG: hypothetical protein GY761_16260 [Hyphomicrobiales bacterium]|nr:hypothetical protein [Hyphomicrobiales bacterium]